MALQKGQPTCLVVPFNGRRSVTRRKPLPLGLRRKLEYAQKRVGSGISHNKPCETKFLICFSASPTMWYGKDLQVVLLEAAGCISFNVIFTGGTSATWELSIVLEKASEKSNNTLSLKSAKDA